MFQCYQHEFNIIAKANIITGGGKLTASTQGGDEGVLRHKEALLSVKDS